MIQRRRRRWLRVIVLVASAAAPAHQVRGQADSTSIEELRRELEVMKQQMQGLQEQMRKQEQVIRALEEKEGKRVATPAETVSPPVATASPPAAPAAVEAAAPSTTTALDRALAEARTEAPRPAVPGLVARQLGPATFRLIDISWVTLFAAGTSTERNATLEDLEGGAHDPNQRGFTLQQGELSLSGAVDPYFTGESHIVFTPDGVELEEAFLTTTALPYGLQLEAGHFFTEFGRINPLHPHAWNWIDQPVINTRLFGGDGLRNPGFRLGWLAPLPWFSEVSLGAQNASGETAVSYLGEQEGEGIGNRPLVDRDVRNLGDLLYLTRWENAWTLSDSLSMKIGGSGLFGPNASGFSEDTRIYGTDLVFKWRPPRNFRGWPFFLIESELMWRDYEAAAVVDSAGINTLPKTTLYDWGLYVQGLYGFRYGWAGGLRYEYASGSGQSVGGRQSDPFRADRQRLSPLLVWHPTEFSRIRLQYNFDVAEQLNPNEAHTGWVGFEIFYGAHAAHKY